MTFMSSVPATPWRAEKESWHRAHADTGKACSPRYWHPRRCRARGPPARRRRTRRRVRRRPRRREGPPRALHSARATVEDLEPDRARNSGGDSFARLWPAGVGSIRTPLFMRGTPLAVGRSGNRRIESASRDSHSSQLPPLRAAGRDRVALAHAEVPWIVQSRRLVDSSFRILVVDIRLLFVV